MPLAEKLDWEVLKPPVFPTRSLITWCILCP